MVAALMFRVLFFVEISTPTRFNRLLIAGEVFFGKEAEPNAFKRKVGIRLKERLEEFANGLDRNVS